MINKKYAMIASIPTREKMLERTIKSLYPFVDDIYIALNGYKHIPECVLDCRVIILDNSMGDAGKFYFAEKLKGYLFTCDDDLIYPPDYVEYMIKGVEKYKCACTLHGRNYSRPVIGFQQFFDGYPCLHDVKNDIKVDIGGDGVMCWHTDFLKVKFSDFKQKNMSQIYFSKLCHNQGINIMCLKHKEGYLGYMNPSDTIWEQEARKGFVKQTELLKEFLK